MSNEQPLDTGGFRRTVRRYRVLVALVVVLAAGAAATGITLRPPAWSSTSQVLLPPPPTSSSGQSADRDVQTYVAVARSEAVLTSVRRQLGSDVTLRRLQGRLKVSAPSSDVIAVRASGSTPVRAEGLARAVAQSLVRYLQNAASSLTNAQLDSLKARAGSLQASLSSVRAEIASTRLRAATGDARSPAGRATADALAQLTAQEAQLVLNLDAVRKQRAAGDDAAEGSITNQARVIQASSAATRLPMPVWQAGAALGGALAGLLVSLLVVATLRRRRRRLWSRDALADAVGTPVLASLRSRTPRSAGGWTSLLGGYEPGPVDAWALRQLVREHLLPAGRTVEGLRVVGEHEPLVQRRLLVIGFADDPAATAVTAQLASYTAATGVRTRFVAGQHHASANRLWAACAALEGGDVRDGLRVDAAPERESTEQLTVVIAVVERHDPRLDPRVATGPVDATLVAVSPGTSTGEELARLAVATDAAGLRLDGLIVADADDQEAGGCRISRDRRGRRGRQQRPTAVTDPTPAGPSRPAGARRARSTRSVPAQRTAPAAEDRTEDEQLVVAEESVEHEEGSFVLDDALDRGAAVIPVAGRRRRTS